MIIDEKNADIRNCVLGICVEVSPAGIIPCLYGMDKDYTDRVFYSKNSRYYRAKKRKGKEG